MAVDEYRQNAAILASHVSATLAARQDIEALIGKGNEAMMQDYHGDHARFICLLLRHYGLNVLRGTVK